MNSFPVVPVHILDTLFAPFSCQATFVPKRSTKISSHTLEPPSKSNYLSTLGCTLPPDWKLEQSTSAIVAKDDEAKVQTHMWDKRISVLYPSFTSTIINVLRSVVLLNIFKNLYKEFVNFMQLKHTTNWINLMREGGYSALNNYGGGGRRAW